jgi:hypothetical protein
MSDATDRHDQLSDIQARCCLCNGFKSRSDDRLSLMIFMALFSHFIDMPPPLAQHYHAG